MKTSITEAWSTDRLWLRKLDPSYTRFLLELNSDPVVMEFINGGVETPKSELLRQIDEYFGNQLKWDNGFGLFGVHDRLHGLVMGWVSLKPDRFFPGSIEIGYRFKKEYWGNGFATEAATAMLTRASILGLPTVIAHTLERNVKSQHVMKKLGMHLAQEFVYPAWVSKEWSKEERKGVRYEIDIAALTQHSV